LELKLLRILSIISTISSFILVMTAYLYMPSNIYYLSILVFLSSIISTIILYIREFNMGSIYPSALLFLIVSYIYILVSDTTNMNLTVKVLFLGILTIILLFSLGICIIGLDSILRSGRT